MFTWKLERICHFLVGKVDARVEKIGALQKLSMVMPSIDILHSALRKAKRVSLTKGWWFEKDSVFILDEEGRAEKQQCDVAASKIPHNFSFMPDNEVIMRQHKHCLGTLFQCQPNYVTVLAS